ncbi:MAG TPA: type II secretion system minor pseudopilin GspI [Steroidobacteraceae bacterium]
MKHAAHGFTLLEVLVALVIVAFGMGAVLASLSSAANNVGALREKTLAQWIALNRIADVRLNLQAPTTGTTQGDVKGFGNGDWHWQQVVTAMQQIPGLMQITVSVRRNTPSVGTSTKGPASANAASWLTTVVGFRGDALAAASGETLGDWNGTSLGGTGSSSSGGAIGTVPNPGTNPPPTPITSPTIPGGSSAGGS